MRLNRYEFSAGESFESFEFISEGPKGKIRKLIHFSLINEFNYYNLALGDINSISGDFDDFVVTDNGDTEKVLATVVAAAYAFCDKHPDSWIYATGSTAARTRLYRMGINKHFDTVKEDFEVYGEFQNEWEEYIKDKNYQAFVVKKRKFEV